MFGWGIYMFLTGILEKRIGWLQSFYLSIFTLCVLLFIYNVIFPFKQKKLVNHRKNILIIGFLFTIAWLLVNLGFSLGYVSLVSLITSISTAVTMILGVIFLKEKLVQNQVFGIVIILIGLFLLGV